MNTRPFLSILIYILLGASPARAVELSPVVVTSELDKQGTPLVTAPGSILRRDRSTLKGNAPDSLSSSLGAEPNVDFSGGPRTQAERPQIRGLGSERILILEDGVRQSFQSNHSGRIFSDFSLVESLEVVKGPWSSLYGSGAMGGVVNFRKSTAADFIQRTGKDKGVELATEAASAADQFGQRLTAFAKSGRFQPLVSFHHLKGGDVRLGSGERLPYSGSESNDLYSSLEFGIDSGQSAILKINRYVDKSKAPLDPEVETQTLSELGDSTITKTDFVGDYRLTRAKIDFHAKPYVRETEVKKVRLSDGRTDTQAVGTLGIDLWNNVNLSFTDDLKSIVTTGIEYFKDHNKGRREGASLPAFPDGTGEQWGVYLQPSLTLAKKLSLIPGVRYDSFKLVDSSGNTATTSGDKTSLKIYSSYEYVPERIVFIGWGQAYNSPRLQDVYISGLHFPGNFFVPNPKLKPEIANTWEAGTKNRFRLNQNSLLAVNGTYFMTQARDFIARSVDVGGGTTTFENLERVKLHGIELSTLWQGETFGTGLSFGQVRSLNQTSGEPLEDTLPDQWSGKFEFYFSEYFTAGTDLILAERQDRVRSGAAKTPGYFVENFYASYTTRVTEVVLRLNNAYDRNYRKHNSAINDVGRDLRLTASWAF